MKLEPVAWMTYYSSGKFAGTAHTKAEAEDFAECFLRGKVIPVFPDIPEGYVVVPVEQPPTLAEIERLADALAQAGKDYAMDYCDSKKIDKAHAALMAAIRAYGRE